MCTPVILNTRVRGQVVKGKGHVGVSVM